MYASTIIALFLSATAAFGAAVPSPDADLSMIGLEARRVLNPNAITGTTCTSPGTKINGHDINVALLSICGGIAGKITQCQGAPAASTGASGTAKFDLKAATAGTTINISKGRWEACVFAARAVCGDSPFKTTCIGGANGNKANVDFTLSAQ